jgi:hypothetical protein
MNTMQPTSHTFKDHRYVYYLTSPTCIGLLSHRDTILILPKGSQDYYSHKITIKEIIITHPDIAKNNK